MLSSHRFRAGAPNGRFRLLDTHDAIGPSVKISRKNFTLFLRRNQ
jgi:hypothetical protein